MNSVIDAPIITLHIVKKTGNEGLLFPNGNSKAMIRARPIIKGKRADTVRVCDISVL